MGQASGVATSWGVVHGCSSDLVLLRLWCRLASATLLGPPGREFPYDEGAAIKREKRGWEEKKNPFPFAVKSLFPGFLSPHLSFYYSLWAVLPGPFLPFHAEFPLQRSVNINSLPMPSPANCPAQSFTELGSQDSDLTSFDASMVSHRPLDFGMEGLKPVCIWETLPRCF